MGRAEKVGRRSSARPAPDAATELQGSGRVSWGTPDPYSRRALSSLQIFPDAHRDDLDSMLVSQPPAHFPQRAVGAQKDLALLQHVRLDVEVVGMLWRSPVARLPGRDDLPPGFSETIHVLTRIQVPTWGAAFEM